MFLNVLQSHGCYKSGNVTLTGFYIPWFRGVGGGQIRKWRVRVRPSEEGGRAEQSLA